MIRGAVIGCGRMGAFTSAAVRDHAPACWFPLAHLEAIQALPGVTVVGACDPDAAALARAVAAYGVAGFADVDAMLAKTAPDLVGIATRTPGRAALIEHCVAAGVRALHVEKPLCNSVAELTRLEDLFARPDLFVTWGAVRRHFAPYRQGLALAGTLGELREIRVAMGPGGLCWVHPHSVDLILAAAGSRQLTGVQARLEGVEPVGAVAGDPIVLHASLWFEDGVAGHVGRATGYDLTVDTTGGAVTVANDGAAIRLLAAAGDDPYPVSRDVPLAPADTPQGTAAALAQLAACLADDAEAIAANAVVKADILRAQRVLFAMAQSHRAGGVIVDPDTLDPALEIRGETGGRPA